MRKFNVVFDSSVLYTKTDTIVCLEFEDFIQEFSDKCNLKIYIPGVVKGELCYRKVSSATEKLERAKESLSSIGKILDRQRTTPYKTEELRPLVEKRFDRWAKSKNIILLETPYNKISLKELQENSIWRVPPFEDVRKNLEPCKKCRSEKGFRDALILFSVLELAKKIAKNKVYFICGDKLLLKAVNNQGKGERLVPLEKIEDLSSRLRLSFEEDNEKWINLISNRARDVFYRRVWKECKIREEIEKRYTEHFEIPSTSEFEYLRPVSTNIQQSGFIPTSKYANIYDPNIYTPGAIKFKDAFGPSYNKLYETKAVPLDKGTFHIGNPSFQEIKDNNIYVWKSRVSHHRKYRDAWDTGLNIPKVYKIHFDVIWSAKVTRDERFCNLKLLDIKFIDKEFTLSLD